MAKALEQSVLDLQKGHSDAFSDFYALTVNAIHAKALAMMKNEADAQDVMQNAYTKMLRGIGTLADAKKAKAWALRIVINECYNVYNKKKELLTDDGNEFVFENQQNTSIEAMPEQSYDMKERRKIIFDMIQELPLDQKAAVMCYYVDGLSVKETAEVLDCPVNTVKTRLKYARTKLRQAAELRKKKGISVYSFGFIPFVGIVIRLAMNSVTITGAQATSVFAAVNGAMGTTQVGSTTAIATSSAVETIFATVGTKAVAIIIAGVVTVGSISANIYTEKPQTQESNYVYTDDAGTNHETVPTTEPPNTGLTANNAEREQVVTLPELAEVDLNLIGEVAYCTQSVNLAEIPNLETLSWLLTELYYYTHIEESPAFSDEKWSARSLDEVKINEITQKASEIHGSDISSSRRMIVKKEMADSMLYFIYGREKLPDMNLLFNEAGVGYDEATFQILCILKKENRILSIFFVGAEPFRFSSFYSTLAN
jgi:RNA polymerase sigma factor (sigma-70 family)